MTASRTMVFVAIGVVAVACSAARMEDSTPAQPVPAESLSAGPAEASKSGSHVDFESQIRPFLETGCAPCHFKGGKMYEPLPFDSPATIRMLGADKLFTRVKDEQQRALIRAFLAQPA